MDDFSTLARDYGFRPQGKAAPMKAGMRSDGGDRRPWSSSTTSSPLFDDQKTDGLLFNDVYGGPPKYSSTNSKPSSTSDFDYNPIFKSSATNEPKSKSSSSSEPIYDKPVFDDDILDELPGLKSKSMFTSSAYDENVNVFASMTSPSKKSDNFDDLIGNLGRAEKIEDKNNTSQRGFDDLLPGFGSGSPSASNRPSSVSTQPKSISNSNQTASSTVIDEPFVVLDSNLTDPLEELNKFSTSEKTKTDAPFGSGGIFDDIDPLNSFGSTAQEQPLKSSSKYSEIKAQKKPPFDDLQDSHQPIFDIPTVSTDSHKSNVNHNFKEAKSRVDPSPKSEKQVQQQPDDIWLTVAEIPLFTQPTRAPPPSRPPPPIPGRGSRSERGSFATRNNRRIEFSQSPRTFRPTPKSPAVSQVDELEDFGRGGTRNSADDNADIHSGAAAAAMKEAMDRAEAKFRHAKEVREREFVKSSRSKDDGDDDDEKEEIRERRQWEEEERERKRLEKERERAREIERERARQAVERANREARERAAMEARRKTERAAVQRAQNEARERAAAGARERAERVAAEAREREKEARDKAEARRQAERAAAAEARERAAAAARMNQQKNDDDLESFFSANSRPSSAPRPRASSSDPVPDPQFQSRAGPGDVSRTSSGASSNMKKASSTTNIFDDLTSVLGTGASSAGEFQDIEGETEERRRARLERHQRTQERAAKALAEKNQRDLQTQREQEERHRIAETLDFEVKRWAAGKEGNLRSLLSTLQYVLWPECGWQPVSLTDLMMGASVKKAYRKATLCIHPDKVQQKGANLQQKYIAEKVFDLLKEAWNKFNSEELF